MELTKQSQNFEGKLSNGKLFTLDLIKRGDSWLFGIEIPGKPLFFTSSEAFKDVKPSQVTLELSQQLEDLGVPGEDTKHFINQLAKLVD